MVFREVVYLVPEASSRALERALEETVLASFRRRSSAVSGGERSEQLTGGGGRGLGG